MKICSKSGYIWYYEKVIRFHPLIPKYIVCRVKDGEVSWIGYQIFCNEHIPYSLENKEEVRKEIESIKEQYEDILGGD